MKITIWDILAILSLLAVCIIGAVTAQIYINPRIFLNPFPPPTQPPIMQIPTFTPTQRSLPSTWTIVPPDTGQEETLQPSSTPVPTQTEFIMATFTVTTTFALTTTNTRTPGPDQASLISQSPTNGATLGPREDFDLVWKVKNVGSKDWNTQYYYRYASGTKGYKNPEYKLKSNVGAGSTANLIVDMIAPGEPGNYKTTWQFYNDSGELIASFSFSFTVK